MGGWEIIGQTVIIGGAGIALILLGLYGLIQFDKKYPRLTYTLIMSPFVVVIRYAVYRFIYFTIFNEPA